MIRMATPEDLDTIQYLGERQSAEMPELKLSPDRAHTLTILELRGEYAAIFIAYDGDTPVGWIGGGITKTYYDTRYHAFIDPIYVVPEARGRIYAIQLLEMFEEWASKYHITSIALGLGADMRAKRLIEAYGYEQSEIVYTKEIT